jgi:hypothetical protein
MIAAENDPMRLLASLSCRFLAIASVVLMVGCTSSERDDSSAVHTGGKSDAGPSDAGPSDAGPSDGGSLACHPTIVTGLCGECVKAECCDAMMACENDADCASCVANHGPENPACLRAQARFRAFISCAQGACVDACYREEPINCDGVIVQYAGSRECATCSETNCCTQYSDCGAIPSCKACLANPHDATCAGMPTVQAVQQCVSASCSSECGP